MTVAGRDIVAVEKSPAAWWRLDYLPIGLFAAVMALTGLSIAWRLASAQFGLPAWISAVVADLALGTFGVLVFAYGFKAVTALSAVRDEFNHPVRGQLFGTLFISLLLLPILVAPTSLIAARLMWLSGAVAAVLFAWFRVSRWITTRQQLVHATPAWLVPIVGLLNVPLALPALQLPQVDAIMVLGLASGLFFVIPLFTLILARLLFEPPMPPELRPSLLILVAPFAVGFSSYAATAHEVDLFARALYALMIFMLAVVLPQLAFLPRSCPFRVSWWSVTFPLAASAVAALRLSAFHPDAMSEAAALALLTLSTTVIAWVLGQTVIGLVRGELRTLSS